MRTDNYIELIELEHQQGLFKPVNQVGIDLISNLKHKERIYVKDAGKRDIRFHRAYFALLNYIYSWMPEIFKMQIPEKHFYKWLKILLGEYKIIYKFKTGESLYETKSIAFGKMSQKTFEEYVKNQLPLIYDNLIYALFNLEEAKMIIENIENEFEKFLNNF